MYVSLIPRFLERSLGLRLLWVLMVGNLYFYRTTFSEFARANSKDERFKDIEKMREREALFHERITELKKINKQKEEGQKQAMKNKVEKVSDVCCVKL